ncbi:hypothetical protein AB0L64_36195 [Kribbella sp. NPDC051936]|uniref:hypothetical protein n=1 Tax=Kribbella sp. NPDC051936 TaxID=3154946 RepID=UPI00344AF21D
MLLIAEAAWHGEPGWLFTVASVAAMILWAIGFGALRIGRVGDRYSAASAVLIVLLVVAAGLQSVLLTVAGFSAAFVLGGYGTVMRFRRPKGEGRPS